MWGRNPVSVAGLGLPAAGKSKSVRSLEGGTECFGWLLEWSGGSWDTEADRYTVTLTGRGMGPSPVSIVIATAADLAKAGRVFVPFGSVGVAVGGESGNDAVADANTINLVAWPVHVGDDWPGFVRELDALRFVQLTAGAQTVDVDVPEGATHFIPMKLGDDLETTFTLRRGNPASSGSESIASFVLAQDSGGSDQLVAGQSLSEPIPVAGADAVRVYSAVAANEFRQILWVFRW